MKAGAEQMVAAGAVATGRRVDFLGCPMDLLTTEQFLAEARAAIERRDHPRTIQFVNGNKVAKVAEDPEFKQVLWRADYVLTDGQPMIPLARCLGIRVPERIDGIGLMDRLLGLANERQFRVYLLGAKQEVVEACAARIRERFPGVVICGLRNGYFSKPELPAIAETVRASMPDILFLGIGSPMKEEIAVEYREAFGAPIIQGVGGSFDVIAGMVKRAPRWMQRVGLEWCYRVWQEPRRMFWRYATTNTTCLRVFARTWLRQSLGGSRESDSRGGRDA